MRIILPLLLFTATLAAQTADSLSLERFLQLATERSLQRQAAERDQALATLDNRSFRASLLPQLRATANVPNYNKTFSEITQPDGTVRFQPVQNNNSALGLALTQVLPLTGGTVFVQSNLQRFDDFETDFSLYNGLPFRVGLSQPIFAYNAIKWERQLAPLRLQEAQRQYTLQLEQLRVTATQLYFDLLLASQESRIADTNFVANERLYAIAQERYALGKVSRRDLLQLELEKLSAQRGQLRARQEYDQASAALAVFLGEDPNQHRYRPVEPSRELPVLELDENTALAWARARRPEWLAVQRRQLEARQQLARARRTDGPELQLTAAFGRVRSSGDLADIYQDALPEAFVELQVNVPIFDGGQRRARVQQAVVSQAYTEAAVQREILDLESQVRNTLRDFRSLEQELGLVQQLRELTEERFRITTESYVLGATPLTELTLAQREKDGAARTYVAALRAYWLTVADLRQLTLGQWQ
ncbi:MAG: hypothetical protein DA408_10390 [Bacteroidetes bacterium]|nr:MAG: hypothetical protein C7N36_10165 [Bacteroidota bacterium]PTM12466.1 MAG: hypothetical protein DA408_10390 [Bacteroidota bacterium]